MTENIKFCNSLVERIKMVLQEATERHTNHDFNTDMAIRAQQTAELYQIIDGISKDESKLELLQVKQRLRDRIQEMEDDIKIHVSQILAEEATGKTNKAIEKDQGKYNVKPFSLKANQSIFHPRESPLKQLPSNRSYLSPSRRKDDSQQNYNLIKSQNLEHRSCPLFSSYGYPAKQYVLPLHSCSCLQNAYFYPLAQPSRIRKEAAVRTHTSLNSKDSKRLSIDADKIYLERRESTHETFPNIRPPFQPKNNLEEHCYSNAFQNNGKFKQYDEKFETEINNRQHSFPEVVGASIVTESKSSKKLELEKIYKSKSVQTDKHITWKSSKCKSNDKHKELNHRKILEKHRFPNPVKRHSAQCMMKHRTPIRINTSSNLSYTNLSNTHYKSEPVYKSSSRMNDYLSDSIKHLETRSQNEVIHNLRNVDKAIDSHEVKVVSKPESTTDILDVLNRFFSDTRNEQDIAALYSLLSVPQETTIQNVDTLSERIPDIDKDLLEKLIVDVIFEDLQDLSNPPDENIASTQSSDKEVSSTTSNVQENLNVIQHSEHEDSELSASKIERNVVTPELSPKNSLSSSSSSSPFSSPRLTGKSLPVTPLLSEQESPNEEILQYSQLKEDGKTISPLLTPDLTPPLSPSHKPYVATPVSSPQAQKESESASHNTENKKSVRDASVQVSKLSNSGESTLGTIATSISDSTDEFLSDGELLLKSYGQVPIPAQLAKQQKKNTVTIQDYPVDRVMSQISKSSLSEGEVPLITKERSLLNQKHSFRIIDSSIDEMQFPEPTNSTFEQVWEDISEGQLLPHHITGNFKALHLNQTSNFHEREYQRQQSHTLSEGEIISTPQDEDISCKNPSSMKCDDFNDNINLTNQFQNNNLSLSSGEVEDGEDNKLNNDLLINEEENIPMITDAEFYDADKEPSKVLD